MWVVRWKQPHSGGISISRPDRLVGKQVAFRGWVRVFAQDGRVGAPGRTNPLRHRRGCREEVAEGCWQAIRGVCHRAKDERSRGTKMLDGLKCRLVTHLGFSQASEEPQRSRTDRHTPDPATVAERQSIFLWRGGWLQLFHPLSLALHNLYPPNTHTDTREGSRSHLNWS